MASFLFRPIPLFSAAILLRVILFFYGLLQDAHSPMKYTDIDYYVFTSASRSVSLGHSPYDRETYRYTPLLAWLLVPTAWPGWFSFGKALFAAADILTGYLIVCVLRSEGGMSMERALKYASIWLLNPMVATISTRGSSEGVLAVMVVALLWAVLQRRVVLAGLLLGVAVHFKIYPFIYAPAIVWWMDDERLGKGNKKATSLVDGVRKLLSKERIMFAVVSLATFGGLNAVMYYIYGPSFLQHTYLHHITRIDHRHNFSPYNILLYLSSARTFHPMPPSALTFLGTIRLESLAFIPQMLLSCLVLPFLLAKKDLPSTLLAQTFAFVTFNKVCTSQYFLWYLVFLPFYLPRSSLLSRPMVGVLAGVAWVGAQVWWLQQGFELEFKGRSTFVPGLWGASSAFYLVNAWLLGMVVSDVGLGRGRAERPKKALAVGEGDGKGTVKAADVAEMDDAIREKASYAL